jgi:hypothetical protein
MFVVAAASPAAVDTLTMHLESHDAEHFAIGGIITTIFLMWTLIGCGSGRSWTVTLTASSVTSLTFTALLAVVAIVKAGFMTEEMDPDSRSYHEAIITLVIGASWVTHLALSILTSARGSTRRKILSMYTSTPRSVGPRNRGRRLGACQRIRGKLFGRPGRARFQRHGLERYDYAVLDVTPHEHNYAALVWLMLLQEAATPPGTGRIALVDLLQPFLPPPLTATATTWPP